MEQIIFGFVFKDAQNAVILGLLTDDFLISEYTIIEDNVEVYDWLRLDQINLVEYTPKEDSYELCDIRSLTLSIDDDAESDDLAATFFGQHIPTLDTKEQQTALQTIFDALFTTSLH